MGGDASRLPLHCYRGRRRAPEARTSKVILERSSTVLGSNFEEKHIIKWATRLEVAHIFCVLEYCAVPHAGTEGNLGHGTRARWKKSCSGCSGVRLESGE